MSAQALVGLGLASARLWALLRVQPSWRRALGLHWEWIAGGLAVSVALLAVSTGSSATIAAATAQHGTALAVALVFELLLGTVLGLIAALPGHALVGAAERSGASLAGRRAGQGLATVVIMASLAAGLGLGLHGPLLTSLTATLELLPIAAPTTWVSTLQASASASAVALAASRMSTLALALATPVLLTQLLSTVALATLTRADGIGRGLAEVVGPGLRFAAALIVLGAAWSTYPEAFARGM